MEILISTPSLYQWRQVLDTIVKCILPHLDFCGYHDVSVFLCCSGWHSFTSNRVYYTGSHPLRLRQFIFLRPFPSEVYPRAMVGSIYKGVALEDPGE